MRTFFTPPPSLFDTDPLEISRFGVRLANENQTFWPMENQTACGIKRPMEIKQNGNQTTNRKSNPNRFRNAKRFRNRFGKRIKRPMEIKKMEIKRPTGNQTQTVSETQNVSQKESKKTMEIKQKEAISQGKRKKKRGSLKRREKNQFEKVMTRRGTTVPSVLVSMPSKDKKV